MFTVKSKRQLFPLALSHRRNTSQNGLANQVKSRAQERRVINLSYAGLCIYRIIMGRRGFNSICTRARIIENN